MNQQKSMLTKQDLIPDAALKNSGDDRLDHAPVARIVSDLARAVHPKSNIALFGPWGSGKSSIYAMMKAEVEAADPSIRVVAYDAWKFGGNSLHRNFLMHLAQTLNVPSDRYLADLHGSSESTRLRLGTFLMNNKASLVIAFAIATLSGGAWLALSSWAASRIADTAFRSEVIKGAPSAAIVFGAVIAGLLLSNQSLASAVEKRTRSPLQDADQFSTAFDALMAFVTRPKRIWEIKRKKVDKLLIFIDELDRCSPEDVVATLIDLKTFLHHENCVFIVAADRDVLERALEEAPQAKPVRDNEPYYSTAGAFLDKIFQHQMSLPPPRPEALTNFAMTLADQQKGLWEALRTDARRYEDVVYSLVPAHVQSPRRVKVLMNNFSTNARVIESRGMDWQDRAVEVAVLTVLETEFPSVTRDLIHQPRLLDALVTDGDPATSELQRLRRVYNPETRTDVRGDGTQRENQGPTGPLLVENDERNDERTALVSRAQLKLNRQLDAYLAKVHAAGIPFPSPDLIYLQNAGHAQGLVDTDLATLLDFAADTDPEQLVEAFDDASTSDRGAAVVFLSTKANTTFGEGRANIIESCCRLAEGMATGDLSTIAGRVASTVLGEVPKGRWRAQATPGAILLGLLDPTIANPVKRLGDLADAEDLARNGFLSRITPALPVLHDDRAAEVHLLLGAAYRREPDPFHEALQQLPTLAATKLWESQGPEVESTIASLPIETEEVPEPPQVITSRSVRRTAEVAESPSDEEGPETAPERYGALLSALENRTESADGIGDKSLEIGLSGDQPALYEVAREYAPLLRGTVIADPDVFNRRILAAISRLTVAQLFDSDAPEIDFWFEMLDLSRPLDGEATAAAVAKVVEALRDIEVDKAHLVERSLQPLLPSLDSDAAERMVEFVDGVLSGVPFGAPDGDADGEAWRKRRAACYAVLKRLATVIASGTEDRIRLRDLERAIATENLEDDTVVAMTEQVSNLGEEAAAELDVFLAGVNGHSSDLLARARLRIAARKQAGKSSLPVASFRSALTDDVASTTLMEEWLGTSPAVSEVLKSLSRTSPKATNLDVYAASKNVGDRSKLWLGMRKQGFAESHLRAVGKHGVNATVPESMHDAILDGDLTSQRDLIAVLLTADLSRDTSAKQAASRLAVALLNAGVAGSGHHAALVTLNARGAAQGHTKDLRDAFDRFVTRYPSAIRKGDLRKIDALNLLTKRKRSPIAKALGWILG